MSPRLPLLLVPLLTLAPPAIAQEGAEEQAMRLLEDGRAYREQGKPKQALDNFEIIISSFPGTEAVGHAWLEIGRYRMEVEDDVKGAREAFEQVSREHAQSGAAPGAYHYLGLLTLDEARTPAQLEDALAQFARVETLYPGSPWVPRSIQASALVHRRAGRYEDAVALNRRVALEYPGSDIAPRAHFEAGHALALLGEPGLAMEEFQQVRNRFPESPLAEKALERITALYRLHGTPKPVFSLDSAFSISGGNVLKDVRALLVTPDRRLWVASKKTKGAVAFDRSGKMGDSLAAQEPRTLTLAPKGTVVFASESAVRVGPRDIRTFYFPPEKPGEERERVEEILAATLMPDGSMLVSEKKEDTVFRFGPDGELRGRFFERDARKREVTRIVVDGERTLYLLDQGEKKVIVCDEDGRSVRTIGPSGLRKPRDIAVDPFRNVYVADQDQGILVFNSKGEPFFKITGPNLKKATAVTLDATGAVLVYDDGSDRVLRYR